MPSIRAALLVFVAEATHMPSLLADADFCLSALGGAESCGVSLLQVRVEPQRSVPRTLDSVLKSPHGQAQLFSAADPGHVVSNTGGDVNPWSSAQSEREQRFGAPSSQAMEVPAPIAASEQHSANIGTAAKHGALANPFDTAAAKPFVASEQALPAPEQPNAAPEFAPLRTDVPPPAIKGPAPLVASEPPASQGATVNPFDTAVAKPVTASEQAFAAKEHQSAMHEPALPSHHKGKRPLKGENPFDTPAAKPITASAQPAASAAAEPDLETVKVRRPKVASAGPPGALGDASASDTIPDLASATPSAAPAASTVSPAAMAKRVPAAADAQVTADVPKASPTLENRAPTAGISNKKTAAIDPKDPFSDWLYAKDGTKSNAMPSKVDGDGAKPSLPSLDHAGKQQGMGMGMGMGMGLGKVAGKRSPSDKRDAALGKHDHKDDNLWDRPEVPHFRGLDKRGDGEMSVFTGEPGSFVDLQDFPGKIGGPDGFSVAFDAAWLQLGEWTSIIDFGSGDGRDNIVVSNTEDTNGLSFHIYRHGHVSTLDVKNAIQLRTVSRYLCSVSKHGEMKIYKDGKMIGHRKRGNVPAAVKREHLFIGKSNWKDGGSSFKGTVSDLCVWNKQVSWKDAAHCITSSSSSLVYAAHYLPGIMASNPGAQ